MRHVQSEKACTEKIVNSEIREKVDWYCKQSSEYRIPNYQTVTYNIYVCGSFTFTTLCTNLGLNT